VRVVGSKGRGVREIVKKGADFVVRIPMRGRIGSLNVSVAAALPLSDIARRRGAAAGTTVGANAGGTNRDNGSRMLVRYGARPLQRQTARAPDRGRRLRRATGVCKPSAGERHVSQQRVASEANMKGELANLDATEQAELLRRKEVSPLELVDAATTRIEKVNPQLNAVITPLFDKARAKAQQAGGSSLPDGPFRGVPFLLKDLVCATGGDPIYDGMRLLRDARFVAPRLKGDEVNMSSRKPVSSRKPDPLPAIPLAMLLLARVEECIEQLKESADQLGQSRDNKDASRVARETIDFLKHWLTSFQITAGRPL
jgi:hypothetical protein